VVLTTNIRIPVSRRRRAAFAAALRARGVAGPNAAS
jgi:hypothetical protein